ncbi:MAG: PTS system mannose/fructose/sorbose family transporter subunit IID [Desulfohalobiaceae bacterium]|nr:PTS system mannose/fructose/sorbose family transporter subunit IID [Desulfohalobiaceae bacterium]
MKLAILLRCFFRTYFIGANFNTKGLQNIGLSYAMDPGLKALYAEPEELRQARERYLGIYNCHPYWTPLLVGYFLFLELKISRKIISETSLEKVKKTATYTLSAIGDSFFSGSFLVFWSLVLVLLLLTGLKQVALLWFIVCFVLLQLFKIYIFWQGWTKGLTFFQRLKQMNLINWGQRLKYVNAGLLFLIWVTVFPFPKPALHFALASCALGLAIWLVWYRLFAREFLLLVYGVILFGWFWL